jgi:hypothetical protein
MQTQYAKGEPVRVLARAAAEREGRVVASKSTGAGLVVLVQSRSGARWWPARLLRPAA